MSEDFQQDLQGLGLLESEAQVYLTLVRNGSMSASAIASAVGAARSSVYPTLNSLLERGWVEAGAGYGSRFSAVPPEQALSSFVSREKESLVHREKLARRLIERLSSVVEPGEPGIEEFIQVIRNPRAVGERFERLELEAERTIEVFVKAPVLNRSGNPVQEKVLRRGVSIRSLYERAIIDVPEVKPYLSQWLTQGEEARIYEGELPHKLAIFDRQTVLVHLTMPGDQMRTLFIRHPELALSLGMLFDSLWNDSTPLTSSVGSPTPKTSSAPKNGQTNSEGRIRISRLKGKAAQRPPS